MKGIMVEITQQNSSARTLVSLLMACPARWGRMLTQTGSLFDRPRNQFGVLCTVKGVRVSRDTWKCAVLWGSLLPVIEVEMTRGSLGSAPPGWVLEFKEM